MAQRTAPYGTWKSPITSDLIATESISLGALMLDGHDLYWIEMRPAEGGRLVIVKREQNGQTSDVNPPPFNARTRVHEYGGGAYTVTEGTVFFSNFENQRLYRVRPGEDPQPITPAVDLRYADAVADTRRKRLIAIREDHTEEGEAVNTIVSLPFEGDGEGGQVLVSGNSFYSTPRMSPDGKRLAWLTWNHPNMPWDGTELWVGELAKDGTIASSQKVAGGIDEAIFQPEWSPDGVLHFVSDRTGWWNLYRHESGQNVALCEMEAEFGVPMWQFGAVTYAFASPERIVCLYAQEGDWHVATLDIPSRKLQEIQAPYTYLARLRIDGDKVYLLAGSPTESLSVIELDITGGNTTVLRRSDNVDIDDGYISVAEAIEFPTEGGLTAHAFYYPPRNRDYAAPEGERPPLLVMSHGGPTSATTSVLDLEKQYWTSRGVAVLDVNYGGSTSYGREYRRRLNGNWGIVDLDDCVNGARYLAEQCKVDGKRMAITGGSAGGYTTLCALTFRDVFAAGASYYGVSDLEALAQETHKFESRYLDSMVGPYPERKDLYYERSAINYTDRLSTPVIFFQGLEDKVVPPSQAERMVGALRAKGVPVAYIPFEGEQHGFRRAENIKRSLDAEFYFYSRIFSYEPADKTEPVEIENL